MGSKNEYSDLVMYCSGEPVGYLQNMTMLMDSGETFCLNLDLINKESFSPKRILKSGDHSIVFWEDRTKTVVKKAKDEINDDYTAFCAALAIKMFGSNSALKRMIEQKTEYQKERNK